MTNKELFKTLTTQQQEEIVRTLASFEKVHIEFYYGEYHITTAYCLMAKYPSDFKILNEFTNKEFGLEKVDYGWRWYEFWRKKEDKGEKNECYEVNGKIHGKWQDEFEESIMKPIYTKALNEYVRVVE